jgi:hypothetical protein
MIKFWYVGALRRQRAASIPNFRRFGISFLYNANLGLVLSYVIKNERILAWDVGREGACSCSISTN